MGNWIVDVSCQWDTSHLNRIPVDCYQIMKYWWSWYVGRCPTRTDGCFNRSKGDAVQAPMTRRQLERLAMEVSFPFYTSRHGSSNLIHSVFERKRVPARSPDGHFTGCRANCCINPTRSDPAPWTALVLVVGRWSLVDILSRSSMARGVYKQAMIPKGRRSVAFDRPPWHFVQ